MKHYLPQLVDNHGVRVLPAESKWHGDGAQTCDAIGGGLQTGVLPVGVQSSQADVIPDIWARPLLFKVRSSAVIPSNRTDLLVRLSLIRLEANGEVSLRS